MERDPSRKNAADPRRREERQREEILRAAASSPDLAAALLREHVLEFGCDPLLARLLTGGSGDCPLPPGHPHCSDCPST